MVFKGPKKDAVKLIKMPAAAVKHQDTAESETRAGGRGWRGSVCWKVLNSHNCLRAFLELFANSEAVATEISL